ncbi:MAG: formamidopyrimidine-DNA glycosylase [Syntrophus sp. (in: bacteria)]|nr:formamidopyrimidine-DNA glycosylase [Syntrophus sp. (in: bacteria)]
MMPELPEVETLCRQLNEILPGEKILAVEVLDPRLGTTEDEGLDGRKIERVYRQGKYIRIEMGKRSQDPGISGPEKGRGKIKQKPSDDRLTAALHLRMTGRLLWQTGSEPAPPYTRLVISFAAGRLILIDPRRFATFCVRPSETAPALVENPLEGLPPHHLKKTAEKRRLPVKSFLMDQRFVAGIGNIYACEILYHAGIDPRRHAGSLSDAEWRKVQKASAAVLPRAVECRGTTVSDWRDLFGMSGENQNHLEVYSREGKPCRRCGGMIQRTKIGGRGTWFCPICQK